MAYLTTWEFVSHSTAEDPPEWMRSVLSRRTLTDMATEHEDDRERDHDRDTVGDHDETTLDDKLAAERPEVGGGGE